MLNVQSVVFRVLYWSHQGLLGHLGFFFSDVIYIIIYIYYSVIHYLQRAVNATRWGPTNTVNSAARLTVEYQGFPVFQSSQRKPAVLLIWRVGICLL